MFKVYLSSMALRYFLELVVYISFAFLFQFLLTEFNRDLHLIRYD